VLRRELVDPLSSINNTPATRTKIEQNNGTHTVTEQKS